MCSCRTKAKKIDIDVPSANDFVHKVYTLAARKLYTNVYLFEKNVAPLQQQRHSRETEVLIREAVMEAVRDGVPVEHILRAYIDQTVETILTPESSDDLQPESQNTTQQTKPTSSISSTEPSTTPESTPGAPTPTAAVTPATAPTTATPAATTATPAATAATPAAPATAAPAPAPAAQAAPAITTASIAVPTTASPAKPQSNTTSLKPFELKVDDLPPLRLNTENIKVNTSSNTGTKTGTIIETTVNKNNNVSFTATDRAISPDGNEIIITAPKDDATLEAKAIEGARMRAAAEEDDDDDDKINIGEEVKLEIGELVQDLNKTSKPVSSGLEEIEITPL